MDMDKTGLDAHRGGAKQARTVCLTLPETRPQANKKRSKAGRCWQLRLSITVVACEISSIAGRPRPCSASRSQAWRPDDVVMMGLDGHCATILREPTPMLRSIIEIRLLLKGAWGSGVLRRSRAYSMRPIDKGMTELMTVCTYGAW